MDSPVPKRLKEARLVAQISQKKLGIAAGMDEFSASARMNHYEMGRHNPDYATLKRIADILKIPTAYFYSEDDNLAEFIKLFEKLNSQEKMDLLRHMKGYLP
ncbi:helix-turn-helix domain-containing protein [Legionella shakespearei]|uniref:Helix-turn-helix domain protein n=1 Tax=Legionella shakespearei DSM 23087 TaxID=1122169 RepID=A0A0W0YR14_9GAMM|nr:helix-turn-helix transcriptional regulator [Legionella shakespearei]KTD59287.1 Helix-turn-helix domain protein [Legionella shakespearei DSM 23087]